MIFGLGLCVGLTVGLKGAVGAILAVPLLIFALDWRTAARRPLALLAMASSAALGAGVGFAAKVRSVLSSHAHGGNGWQDFLTLRLYAEGSAVWHGREAVFGDPMTRFQWSNRCKASTSNKGQSP